MLIVAVTHGWLVLMLVLMPFPHINHLIDVAVEVLYVVYTDHVVALSVLFVWMIPLPNLENTDREEPEIVSVGSKDQVLHEIIGKSEHQCLVLPDVRM